MAFPLLLGSPELKSPFEFLPVMESDDPALEFHKMDVTSVPYQEDPKEIMLRDWPPAYAVFLRYEPTGQYLSVKKGTLSLSSRPYVVSNRK